MSVLVIDQYTMFDGQYDVISSIFMLADLQGRATAPRWQEKSKQWTSIRCDTFSRFWFHYIVPKIYREL